MINNKTTIIIFKKFKFVFFYGNRSVNCFTKNSVYYIIIMVKKYGKEEN